MKTELELDFIPRSFDSHINPTASSLHHTHPLFQIPSIIYALVIPGKKISVLDLLKFDLPPISKNIQHHTVEKYLSNAKPNYFKVDNIRKIPVPPLSTVTQLAAQGPGAADRGVVSSVRCPHIAGGKEQNLPLWVVSFWLLVHEIHMDGLRAWKDAVEFLGQEKRKDSEGKGKGLVAEHVLLLLERTEWSDTVHGFDRDCEPITSVAQYATTQWLGSTHIQQMLELLRGFLETNSGLVVLDAWFPHILRKFYRGCDSDAYTTSKGAHALRSLGEELAQGQVSKAGGIANINDVHWVTFIVDFKECTILYGDSLSGPINAELSSMLSWWIQKHAQQTFKVARLSITLQSDDFSCGIMAYNALAHAFLPRDHPLLKPRHAVLERLIVMYKVLKRHNDMKVSLINLFKEEDYLLAIRGLWDGYQTSNTHLICLLLHHHPPPEARIMSLVTHPRQDIS